MTQRIYMVSDGAKTMMVQAATQAQALRHVARTKYQVRVAKPIDVAHAMQMGVQLEVAGIDDDQTHDMFGEEQAE